MPSTRTRSTSLAMAAALAVSSLGMHAPVLAADSPEAAVEALFDVIESGDYSDLDALVCAADRDAIREAFDFGAQLGLEDASLGPTVSISIEDRSVQLLEEADDTATVAVGGTLSMSASEEQVETLVRAMLEAEQGPDDAPVSDEEVSDMAGFMAVALNQRQPIDEEVTLIREDGEWLVCGGLVDEPDDGIEPTVSSDGLCGITTPAELSALGTLEYDSASGFGEFCSYTTTDFDRFHSASVSLGVGQDAERLAAAYGAEQELEIVGVPGFVTGPDSIGNQLILQVGDDLLQVSVTVDGEPDFDWLAQASAIAELLVPRVPEFRVVVAGPTPAPTPLPTPEISLCEGLSLDELNAQTGLGFDETQGDRYYCGFNQLDGEPGWHTLALSLTELGLDDYRSFMPGVEDTSVAGQPALIDEVQLIVELPGGAWTLMVSGWVDANDASASLSTAELLQRVAEMVLPTVAVPEATTSEVLDAAVGPADGSSLLCDYVDLDAINALGILEFSEVAGFDDTTCSISRTDLEQGFATIAITSGVGDLAELRSFYVEPQDVTIAGRSGFVSGSELYVDSAIGTLSFFGLLPEDADGVAMDPGEVLPRIADVIVADIEADAG